MIQHEDKNDQPEHKLPSHNTTDALIHAPKSSETQSITAILTSISAIANRRPFTESSCNHLRAVIDNLSTSRLESKSSDTHLVLDALHELHQTDQHSALSLGVMRYAIQKLVIDPCINRSSKALYPDVLNNSKLAEILQQLDSTSGVSDRGKLKAFILQHLQSNATTLSAEDKATLYEHLATADVQAVESSRQLQGGENTMSSLESSAAASLRADYRTFCATLYEVIAPIESRWREHNDPGLFCSKLFVRSWLDILQESPEATLPVARCLTDQPHTRQFVDTLFRYFCVSMMQDPRPSTDAQEQIHSLLRSFVGSASDGVEEPAHFSSRINDCYTRLLQNMYRPEFSEAEDSLRFLGLSKGLVELVEGLDQPLVLQNAPYADGPQRVSVRVAPSTRSTGESAISYRLTKGPHSLDLVLWRTGAGQDEGVLRTDKERLRADLKVTLLGGTRDTTPQQLDFGVVHGGSLRQVLFEPPIAPAEPLAHATPPRSEGDESAELLMRCVPISQRQFRLALDLIVTAAQVGAYIQQTQRVGQIDSRASQQ